MINLTKEEALILVDFLEDLCQRFSNDGCNDYNIPDTKENRDLLLAAYAYNDLEILEDEKERLDKKPIKGKLFCCNSLLVGYLQNVIKEQL